jgi:hypothetical protein
MKRQFKFALLLSLVGLGTPAFAAPAVGASVEQIAETIKAANASLSPDLAEVVKMADAGVDEKTILTYIENSAGFRLKADDIIFLHKHGISPSVVTALLQHPAKTQIAQPQIAQPAQPQPQVATAPVYATPPAQPVYVQSPPVIYTDPGYYYGYPSYGYGCSYPSVSIGLGVPFFPRPFFHGGFHSGFHGGFHGGGLHVRTFGGPSHFGGGLHSFHR